MEYEIGRSSLRIVVNSDLRKCILLQVSAKERTEARAVCLLINVLDKGSQYSGFIFITLFPQARHRRMTKQLTVSVAEVENRCRHFGEFPTRRDASFPCSPRSTATTTGMWIFCDSTAQRKQFENLRGSASAEVPSSLRPPRTLNFMLRDRTFSYVLGKFCTFCNAFEELGCPLCELIRGFPS